MEVKPGYKQTELGIIPEDWECTTVGRLVFERILDKPLDGNHGNIHPKSGDFVSSGIPFVMANNIQRGRVDLSDCSFIRKEQADSLQKGFSRPGDVLLTHKATIGNTAIVGNIPFEYIMLTPQVTYYRVTNRSRLSNLYLRQFFDSAPFQGILSSMSGGGTRAYIGITAQLRLPVVVPPTKGEQEAIAEMLGDADAFIESLERLIAQKRYLKQGATQELLTGKRRLPGFSGKWKLKPLMDFVKSDKFAIVDGPFGSQMKVDEFVSEGVPVVEMEQLNDGVIAQYPTRCLTPTKFEELKRSAVYPGDIVISKTGSLGHLGLVPASIPRAMITSRLAKISLDRSRADDYFIFQCLLRLRSKGYWESVSQGGTMQILGIRMLQDAPIPDVCPTEQRAVAAVLSDMDAEIGAVQSELSKARQLKTGMMQELLTGRIRLR
jgi:type I restriction enzyme S subunit